MKHTLLAAVVASLAGTAAIAGSPEPYIEHVYMDPPRVMDDQWDGFYGGVLGGIQDGEVTPGPFPFDAVNYGAFAGYNFQHDKIVVGAEVAGQIGSIDFGFPTVGSIDGLLDAKLRLGYAFGDALLYASGGYTTTGMDTGFGTFGAKGWNAGAGLDFAVNDKVFVGGEYVYRNLGTTFPAGFNYTSHGGQLRAGLKF